MADPAIRKRRYDQEPTPGAAVAFVGGRSVNDHPLDLSALRVLVHVSDEINTLSGESWPLKHGMQLRVILSSQGDPVLTAVDGSPLFALQPDLRFEEGTRDDLLSALLTGPLVGVVDEQESESGEDGYREYDTWIVVGRAIDLVQIPGAGSERRDNYLDWMKEQREQRRQALWTRRERALDEIVELANAHDRYREYEELLKAGRSALRAKTATRQELAHTAEKILAHAVGLAQALRATGQRLGRFTAADVLIAHLKKNDPHRAARIAADMVTQGWEGKWASNVADLQVKHGETGLNVAKLAGTRGADELGSYLMLRAGKQRQPVGESHYQQALERISGGRTREGANRRVIARLVPEPDNPYDSKAVSVRVGGQVVAYLPRSEGKQVHAKFTKLLEAVGCDIACQGVIVGGWKRGFLGRDQGHFGIKLDYADL